MVVDANPPLRGDLTHPRKATGNVNIDLRPTPTSVPSNPSQRIASARERSAEYSLNKDLNQLSADEKAQMSSVFRERFSPAGRNVASIQALTSLADAKIEEARAKGQFKNLPRGKPIERDHNADSPYLGTTEYFLNRIIKAQEIVRQRATLHEGGTDVHVPIGPTVDRKTARAHPRPNGVPQEPAHGVEAPCRTAHIIARRLTRTADCPGREVR